MKPTKRDPRRPLELRKETLRQLDPADLGQVSGGARRVANPDFNLAAYLKYCMGTV